MSYWKLWLRTTHSNAMSGAGVATDVIEFNTRQEADEAYDALKTGASKDRFDLTVVKLYKDL